MNRPDRYERMSETAWRHEQDELERLELRREQQLEAQTAAALAERPDSWEVPRAA